MVIQKYPAYNIIFIMSWIQPNISQYAKKQENMTHGEKKYLKKQTKKNLPPKSGQKTDETSAKQIKVIDLNTAL